MGTLSIWYLFSCVKFWWDMLQIFIIHASAKNWKGFQGQLSEFKVVETLWQRHTFRWCSVESYLLVFCVCFLYLWRLSDIFSRFYSYWRCRHLTCLKVILPGILILPSDRFSLCVLCHWHASGITVNCLSSLTSYIWPFILFCTNYDELLQWIKMLIFFTSKSPVISIVEY